MQNLGAIGASVDQQPNAGKCLDFTAPSLLNPLLIFFENLRVVVVEAGYDTVTSGYKERQ